MDILRLRVSPSKDDAGVGFQVEVFVNEVEMTSAGAGLGMDPYRVLVPTNRLVPLEAPHTTPIACCDCGVGTRHMGYELRAVLGRGLPLSATDLFAEAPLTGDVWTVPLEQGFALMPMVDDVLDALFAEFVEGPVVKGFTYLTVGIVEAIARFGHEVAYVEVDMFGGSGTQAAVVVGPNGMTTKPLRTTFGGFGPPRLRRADWAINTALRALGALRSDPSDEFEAVGLQRHRHTDDWL